MRGGVVSSESLASAPGLAAALRAYVEARGAALVAARKYLGIRETDARALLFILDHPGTRPGEIRSYLGITSAGVTTLVDRLVDRGVIRRDIDRMDRRMVRLTSTVDLSVEPWSALTRFDDDVSRAIDALDPQSTAAAAGLLHGLTPRALRTDDRAATAQSDSR